MVQRTDVGLGEAYMDGDYLVDDLGSFMALMVANARNLEGQKGMLGLAQWANEKLLAAAHARRSNTREGEMARRAGLGACWRCQPQKSLLSALRSLPCFSPSLPAGC